MFYLWRNGTINIDLRGWTVVAITVFYLNTPEYIEIHLIKLMIKMN